MGCSDTSVSGLTEESIPPDEERPSEGIPDGVATGGLELGLCQSEEVERGGILVWVDHAYGTTEGRTDSEGRVQLTPLPAGVWVVRASRGAGRFAAEVQIVPGETTLLEVDDCPEAPPYQLLGHTSEALYTLDTASGDVVRLSPFTPQLVGTAVTDIAVRDDTNEAYALGATGALYTLDVSTGTLEYACAVPGTVNALAWAGDDRLVIGAASDLVVIRPATCEITDRMTFDGMASDGDLAATGVPGRVYWAVTGARLVEVDLDTGEVIERGKVGAAIWGLAVFGRDVYGFSPSGTVYRFEDGRGTGVPAFETEQRWWGASAGPVSLDGRYGRD